MATWATVQTPWVGGIFAPPYGSNLGRKHSLLENNSILPRAHSPAGRRPFSVRQMRQTPLPNSLWPDSCSTGNFPKSTVTLPDVRDRIPGCCRTLRIIHAPQFVRVWALAGGVVQKWKLTFSLTEEAWLDAVWWAGQRWGGGRGAEELSPWQMSVSSAAQSQSDEGESHQRPCQAEPSLISPPQLGSLKPVVTSCM